MCQKCWCILFSFINVCKISDTVFVKPFPWGQSLSVTTHFAVKILNTKTQKRKNAKCCLQCTDNQCDMIYVILRTFGKGAKWGVLRGWFWLFADGWPLIFCNNKSKNAFFCFLGQGSFCIAPAPLQLFLKEFLWLSHSFYHCWLLVFDFDRRTKEHIWVWPILLWSLYTCVWSLFYFGFWPLAFGSLYCHAEFSSASHRESFLFLSADRSWNKFRMTFRDAVSH